MNKAGRFKKIWNWGLIICLTGVFYSGLDFILYDTVIETIIHFSALSFLALYIIQFSKKSTWIRNLLKALIFISISLMVFKVITNFFIIGWGEGLLD